MDFRRHALVRGLRLALKSEGPLGVAIVHLGAARFWPTGPARYTMDAREAAAAIREIDVRTVVPIHYEGWTHFKQGREAVEDEFDRAGVSERVRWLQPGQPMELGDDAGCRAHRRAPRGRAALA